MYWWRLSGRVREGMGLCKVLATRCACYGAAFTSWDDEAEDDLEDFNMS
jgi:hypothetical protein